MTADSKTTLTMSDLTASEPVRAAEVAIEPALRGSVLVLIQFDVCEEIRLDQLRQLFGARTLEQPPFKHPAPGYVRYQRPPVVEPIEPLILDSGERLEGQIKYYDYGVLSVVFELPFSGDWDTLVRLGSRWVWDVDFEKYAARIVREKLERAAPALVKQYAEWLSEDYFIFHVREMTGSPSAAELCATQGGRIAQIVRGETARLSDSERNEILQSRASYYPNDLAVIGWKDTLNQLKNKPSPSEAGRLVAAAELWLARVKLLQDKKLRLLRWHASGRPPPVQ